VSQQAINANGKLKLSCRFIRHEGFYGSGGIPPFILNLGRWFVSLMSQPLYSPANSPGCPLDRKLGGSVKVSGLFVEETNLLLLLGIEPRFSDVQRHRLNCTITAPSVTLTV